MKTSVQRSLPSTHETQRLQREEEHRVYEEKRQRKDNELRMSVDALLKSDLGRIFWGHLFEICGYNQPALTRMAGGDVAPLSTECKDAQRQIYMQLRKLATPELLAKAEFQAEFGGSVAVDSQKNKKGESKNAIT